MIINEYYKLCPNCGHIMTYYKSDDNSFNMESCKKCGFCTHLKRVRLVTDIANDLGQYKFQSIHIIFGNLNIKYDSGIIIDIAIDGLYVDILLRDLSAYKPHIVFANLSYLDKKLKVIRNVDIMQFL
jgi:hypothetical protein